MKTIDTSLSGTPTTNNSLVRFTSRMSAQVAVYQDILRAMQTVMFTVEDIMTTMDETAFVDRVTRVLSTDPQKGLKNMVRQVVQFTNINCDASYPEGLPWLRKVGPYKHTPGPKNELPEPKNEPPDLFAAG